MKDKLLELIFYAFILVYCAIRVGIHMDPNDGKYKIRKFRDYLFWGSSKRGFSLFNIICQILNYVLTSFWLIIAFAVKEREVTIILARCCYVLLLYIIVITNLIIGAWHTFKNDRRKR